MQTLWMSTWAALSTLSAIGVAAVAIGLITKWPACYLLIPCKDEPICEPLVVCIGFFCTEGLLGVIVLPRLLPLRKPHYQQAVSVEDHGIIDQMLVFPGGRGHHC
jgi:hypothetical protein